MNKILNRMMTLFISLLIIACTAQTASTKIVEKAQMLPAPQILPSDKCNINSNDKITLVYSPADAQVLYTTDGSEPSCDNEKSNIYLDPFSITGENVLVRAKSFKSGFIASYISEREYSVISDLYLDTLTISKGKLSFAKDKYSYNLSVANDVGSVTVSYKANIEDVDYYVNDAKMEAKTKEITLNEGVNNIKITLTKNDKSVTYLINITRKSLNPSSDSSLKTISLTDIDGNKINLNEQFSESLKDYTCSVPYSVAVVNLNAAPTDPVAQIMIDDEAVDTAKKVLKEGNNKITILVTAEDETVSTYTISLNRNGNTPGSNAYLESISIDNIVLTPVFEKATTSYSAKADSSVKEAVFTIKTEDSNAVYTINGMSDNKTVALSTGTNTIKIVVTAADGEKSMLYTINITISDDVKYSYLSSLTIDGMTLTPSFSKENFSYTSTAIYSVESIVVKAVAEDSSSNVSINGENTASKQITLTEGNNSIEVICKSVSETMTATTYKLNIKKEKAPVTGKIILHAKNYSYVYTWEISDPTYEKKTTKMTDEGNGWATITFENVTKTKLIFTTDNNWGGKSSDLDQVEGEWWYENGKWTDYDPDIPETPVITASVKSGTYISAQSVVLSSNNGSGDVIYYTIDGSTPTSSSKVYSSAISITSGTVTLKTFGYNPEALIQTGDIVTYTYTINPDADVDPPSITASVPSGISETPISVSFTIKDNKSATTTAYYTTDGSTPTTSSSKYISGDASNGKTGAVLDISVTKTISFLLIDGSNNSAKGNFYYRIGKVTTSRFDPRQESIYFLLTARWFDGDTSNSIGDQNCSYTESRGANSSNGFSGPEDVTWRGDFKGVVEKLDYIKALGFTTIWITPIVQNRSPLCYHGYHGWDFTKEDARLVSDGYDFQRVIDEAHARDMKICLDIVLNHSGPMGIKDFAEIKYNSPATIDGKDNSFPLPDEWSSWSYDESRFQSRTAQAFPNGWFYDGLTSPGTKNGVAISPISGFGAADLRPFTSADKAQYPDLATTTKYWYDSTMSYCSTIDGKASYSEPNSLTYEQYKTSKRRLRGHNTGFPTGSGSFDNFPDAHFDSLHNHCPDLNTENPDVQEYLLNAYYRYIDMGVDMFRVDTVMHIHKQTLNEMYWPQLLERAKKAESARGGSDFFIFGEVANFVCNPTDKATQLREQNYTWDQSHNDVTTTNHLLNGNNYRTPDYSAKSPSASAPYHVSVINMIAHNAFCNGEGSGYDAAVKNDNLYNDATFMPWYADSHDYGPNKGETRYKGDFAPLWSMLFTFRGIPVVYYGSEIKFQAGKPNDWPTPGSDAGAQMSLSKTGRGYYGPNLEGTVSATDFGEYTASGTVATTLSADLSQHLMGLNKIRQAVPALQMGQYSTDGHSGGWAGYKRRYTGTNKITGEAIDSYVLVGVGTGTHSWTGVLDGTYVDCVTGKTVTASGGSVSFTVSNGGSAGLGVYVLQGLTTPAPGKITQSSPYLK